MSKKERDRLAIMQMLMNGSMTVAEASLEMGISERQCRRLKVAYREEGDAALVHKLRGQPSNNGYSLMVRIHVLTLVRRIYTDFGPTLLAEALADGHNIHVSRETLRRWMLEAGLWHRMIEGRRHRTRRPRRDCIGELVQFDGSHHAWFEDRADPCCLFVFVDDASNRSQFYFSQTEDEHGALSALWQYLRIYGIPRALYLDRHAVYKADDGLTQFGRVCKQLGIELIHARSPQAKGRVERANATHQDRLVKKMRLAGISDIDRANVYINEYYRDNHNERFSHTEGLVDIHRDAAGLDLSNIVCHEEERTVRNDNTIQVRSQILSILSINAQRPLPRRKVIVRWWLDGSLHVFWRETELHMEVCPDRKITGHIPPAPGPNHPWRKTLPIGKAKKNTISELCRRK